jgi:hypothetical protein
MSNLLPHGISVSQESKQINPHEQAQPPSMVPGQKFIPHRQFRTGVFLPDVVLANRRLSGGAKLLWARLARYAGVNGVCFPSCQTLGLDLGCSPQQIQRYVAELVHAGFISAKQRGFNKSNTYTFLWHPDLDELPRKEPHRATEPSQHSETDVSACISATDSVFSVSATGSSCLSEVKSKNEMQAERAHACETTPIIRPCPACPSPEKAKSEPLTPQESKVMDWLRLFQKDLRIGGTVEVSTVREVLKVVTPDDLPKALKYVGDKLADRRRRDHHYRERIDFGLVLVILRQDYSVRGHNDVRFLKRKNISVASAASGAMLGPSIPGARYGEPRRASRDGLSRAGDILRGSRLLDRIGEP